MRFADWSPRAIAWFRKNLLFQQFGPKACLPDRRQFLDWLPYWIRHNQRPEPERQKRKETYVSFLESSGSSARRKLKLEVLARSSQKAEKRFVSGRFAIPRGAVGARPLGGAARPGRKRDAFMAIIPAQQEAYCKRPRRPSRLPRGICRSSVCGSPGDAGL